MAPLFSTAYHIPFLLLQPTFSTVRLSEETRLYCLLRIQRWRYAAGATVSGTLWSFCSTIDTCSATMLFRIRRRDFLLHVPQAIVIIANEFLRRSSNSLFFFFYLVEKGHLILNDAFMHNNNSTKLLILIMVKMQCILNIKVFL